MLGTLISKQIVLYYTFTPSCLHFHTLRCFIWQEHRPPRHQAAEHRPDERVPQLRDQALRSRGSPRINCSHGFCLKSMIVLIFEILLGEPSDPRRGRDQGDHRHPRLCWSELHHHHHHQHWHGSRKRSKWQWSAIMLLISSQSSFSPACTLPLLSQTPSLHRSQSEEECGQICRIYALLTPTRIWLSHFSPLVIPAYSPWWPTHTFPNSFFGKIKDSIILVYKLYSYDKKQDQFIWCARLFI